MLNRRCLVKTYALASRVQALRLNIGAVKYSVNAAPGPVTDLPKRSSDMSQFILSVTPETVKDVRLTTLQGDMIKSIAKDPSDANIAEALRAFNHVLSLKLHDRYSCARLTLLCLNNNMNKHALEPWTRLLEALGRNMHPSALKRVLNTPEFEPAAISALAAFFIIAGPSATPELAEKLVPRAKIPSNLIVLRNYGGIRNKEAEELAMRGLANMASYKTKKFTSPEFIEEISKASFAETENRWKQIQLALTPSEIPQVCYVAIIRRFADTKQTNRSFKVWQQLVNQSGHSVSIEAWAALLRAAMKAPANSNELFTNLWEKMISKGYIPDSKCYTERMLWLTANKHTKEAFALFEDLQKEYDTILKGDVKAPLPIDTQVLNIAIKLAANAQLTSKIDELLNWARERNIMLNSYTFNPLLQLKSAEASSKYFKEMIDANIKPDVITYTFVINKLLKMGLPVDALRDEMKKAGIEPTVEFNSSIAFTIGKQTKNIALSRQFMDTWVRERQPLSIIDLGAFVELELKYGDVDRAVLYSTYTSRFGLAFSVPMHNQIIRHSLKRDRLDVALKELELLTNGNHKRLSANTYTFMHLLDQWSLADLQTRPDVRQLVKLTAEKLLNRSDLIDYPLAKRIKSIYKDCGTELIPSQLHELVDTKLLNMFDKKLAPKVHT